MDRLKQILGQVRVPKLQELRSADYYRSFFKPKGKSDPTFIQNFENSLVYMQEVLVWSDVKTSAAWLLLSQIFLYQFCLSTRPLISSLACLGLFTYLYTTWTHRIWPTIRLQPEHAEDSEQWTSVHPDTLSAPELDLINRTVRARLVEIHRGVWLMRVEEPLRFCISLSSLFIALAILGMKISTPVLIHSTALSVFVIPSLLLYLSRNKRTEPVLLFAGDVLCSLSNLLVYTGKLTPPQEHHELDEFIPEQSAENLDNLDISRQIHAPEPEDLSFTLAPDQSFPSHEEVDLLALSHQDPDRDLLPCSGIVDDISDLEDEIEGPVGRLGGVDDSDTDSADGAFSLSATTASFNSYLPSVTLASEYLTNLSTVTSVTQVLGSLVSGPAPPRDYRSGSEPNLEDFELISEEELRKESP